MSPVALASINSGRLATILLLVLAPRVPFILSAWKSIELNSWRRIYGLCLLLALFNAFTLTTTLISFGVIATAIFFDYQSFSVGQDKLIFRSRIYRRLTLLFVPFMLVAPYSFEAFVKPSRFLAEPGLAIAGGSTPLVLMGNPGGIGALPWWLASPILLVLIVALFSSTSARQIAQLGIIFLSTAVLFSVVSFSSHGNSGHAIMWTGSFLAIATLTSIAAGVVLLDRLRSTLVISNIHYRHILAALLLIFTSLYAVTSTVWSLTSGATSPVQSGRTTVMPAFLTAEPNTKILVLREISNGGSKSVQYYISRGTDIILGQPDVAPGQIHEIESAAQQLIDGSGITSSKVLAAYGIKYVFVKNPFNPTIIRTIDGLGGFARTSATSSGVVWRVSGAVGRLIFTAKDGTQQVLQSGEIGARTTVPGPGTLTLTESFDRSWQVVENGYRLPRLRDAHGLSQFQVSESGEISLIHDGTIRRGWLSLQLIGIVLVVVLALPAGRRKREISESELA